MVRQIDRNKTLTRDEYVYLRDRNRLPRKITVYEDEPWTRDDLAALKRLRAKFEEGGSGATPPSSSSQDGEPNDDYDDRTVEELKEELEDRDIDFSSSDRKADLVQMLREDDEE